MLLQGVLSCNHRETRKRNPCISQLLQGVLSCNYRDSSAPPTTTELQPMAKGNQASWVDGEMFKENMFKENMFKASTK